MKHQLGRYFAVFMALNLLFEVISPTLAMALTNGPNQPEFQGFQPAGASEMVDLFTGDFKYNIPLMDVEGYPINIAYQAGQNMETEASWVGLGWSLNPGVMNRMMRGLPDDFDGDQITTNTNIRQNKTIGVGVQVRNQGSIATGYGSYINVGVGLSWNANAGVMLNYNNYTGHSLELQFDHSETASMGIGVAFFNILSGSISHGNGYRISTADGVTTSNYGGSGYTILNEFNSEKAMGKFNFLNSQGITYNSAQYTSGTTVNSRTGMTYDIYSQSKSASSLLNNFTPASIENSVSRSAMVPTSALAFPPRINNSFTGASKSSSRLFGFYFCAPLVIVPITIEFGAQGGFQRYETTTTLTDPNKITRAYGYMNLENADKSALMDFNRFKDGVYMREAPNGSFASLTNDLFVTSAQGMGGTFRAIRSDYGSVHDPEVRSVSQADTKHRNLGILEVFIREKDDLNMRTVSEDGDWTGSSVTRFYKPNPTTTQDRYYEKSFFKQMGELTASDVAFEGMAGGQSPIQANLNSTGMGYAATYGFGNGKRANRAVRNTHMSYLNALDASDRGLVRSIRDFSMNQFLMSSSTRAMSSFTNKNRTNFNGLGSINHHLSELMVTKDDGSRYIYGIPVYNKYRKQVVFSASDTDVSGVMGSPSSNPMDKSDYFKIVKYTSTDASVSNTRGLDNYFNSTETPAYAQTFLLSAIVSADYVDLTNNGPTQDDLGTYMIFNYTNTNEYKWRSPFNVTPGHPHEEALGGSNMQAHLTEGLKSDEFDDKATYEYGRRDNWYVHSIESKNYVAEFQISLRNDNCGVLNEAGDIDPNSSYKLDQIRLYAKEEKLRAQAIGATAVPIKTVIFEYDYSLCKNVFNNKNNSSYNASPNSGKLTLKKIYFTYGDSKKSALSPYKFTYGDSDHDPMAVQEANPDYDPRAMDRWGGYKPNTGPVNNNDFTYAEQDEALSNNYAAAWNLTTLETPSGAKTDIYYESDDYNYVQDEPNGLMLKIAGFYPLIDKMPSFDYSTAPPPSNIFSSKEILVDLQRMNVGISTTLTKTQADQLVQKSMFPRNKQLYLRCKTLLAANQLYTGLINKDYWEYVPCYAGVSQSGIVDKGNSGNTYTNASGTFYKYAWVRIGLENVVPTQAAQVNPVSRAGWEMMRMYMSRLAYPGSQPNASITGANPMITLIKLLASLGVALQDHKLGMNQAQNLRFMMRGYCKNIDYSDSWVRAYLPYKKKKGGGHRVKKIVTSDNWAGAVSSETTSRYGQQFDYTTTELGATITSGIASYEPITGGDENPMHQPMKYAFRKTFAPNDHYFQETPYMEHLYPAAFVGYSKVTIKNLDYEYAGGGGSTNQVGQIGRTVYEFYTAKDFPVIERKTALDKKPLNTSPMDEYIINPVVYNIEDCSQGFALKLNDMHGKLKSIRVYGQDNNAAPISGITYYYRSNQITSSGGQDLVAETQVIDQNLLVTSQALGRTIDVTTDLRKAVSTSVTEGKSLLRKLSICNPFARAQRNSVEGTLVMGHGSASITKIIQMYGILQKVETFNEKSTTVTENLLRDKNTGEVVLTKVTNNFEQPVYSFTQPAYWVTPQMGHKYTRQGLIYKLAYNATTPNWDVSSGEIPSVPINTALTPGDEVFVYRPSGQKIGDRFWVIEKPTDITKWLLMDVNGVVFKGANYTILNEDLHIKLDRPIERNTQSRKMAGLSSLQNPLTGIPAGGTMPTPNQKIISAYAMEYCQLWDYFKNGSASQIGVALHSGYDPAQLASTSNPMVNPYSANHVGCLRLWRSYVYNDTRDYNSSQPNDKEDGLFTTYSPFWNHTPGAFGGTWDKITSSDPNYAKWTLQGQNNIYSPYGHLIELKDALGIPTCSRPGFNHSLPVLKAARASALETGFDGFEEYESLYPSFGSPASPQFITNDYLGFYRQLNSTLFPNALKPVITKAQAHTGRFSIDFSAGQSVVLNHNLITVPLVEQQPVTRCDPSGLYNLNRLTFDKNYKYLVSFWVKSKATAGDYQNLFTFNAQSKAPGGGLAPAASLVLQKTTLINGWQKFDYEFQPGNLAPNPNNEMVFTISIAGSTGFYLDDFRVQPYNASMSCTVYDPYSLRMWAELDERNFATFMEYDSEGALVRTKKETVTGVYTLNETRKGIKK